MKSLLTAALCTLLVCKANPVFLKPATISPEFNEALEKIVNDFGNDFNTIQGELILKEGETATYSSLINLPNAKGCVITRFVEQKDPEPASWRSVMYKGKSSSEAMTVYKSTVRLLQSSILNIGDVGPTKFKGDLQELKKNAKFAMSKLALTVDDEPYKKLRVQVELVNNYEEWEVNINLFSETEY